MFNPNPRRPLTRRQTARIVVATAILAWATQTLVQQWGFGAILVPPDLSADLPAEVAQATDVALGALLQNQTVERFVPPAQARPARLELRSDATVVGEEVMLRQIARWSETDAATFAPVADLVLANIGAGAPFKSISLAEVKATLRDAGVNLASIHIAGATNCIITRSDVQFDEGKALGQWIAARDGAPAKPAGLQHRSSPDEREPTTNPTANIVNLATDANVSVTAQVNADVADDDRAQNLRNQLIRDLCTRLNLQRDQLQISFKPADEKLLALSQPQFKFEIEPVRVRNLGEVAWNVSIVTGEAARKSQEQESAQADAVPSRPEKAAATQRFAIVANARMWQSQLTAARPIAFKQVIREQDVIEQRTLVDRIPETPCVLKEQAIGQQAARDIKTGALLTAKLVDPVPLVRVGQFVTVTLSQGNIQIKTVARALEGGAYGQTIRVKNETTKDIFQVVITGPQTASISHPQLTSVEGN